MLISYKECLKNHAAAVGGHALDGCGEFMPSITSTPTDPTSLNCAACGCHRNFHRRESDDSWPNRRYYPYRLCAPPSPRSSRIKSQSPSSPIPLPISHIPPPVQFSGPHMLMALSTEAAAEEEEEEEELRRKQRKRKRTKFSGEQKEKMQLFSEKMGWRIGKSEERLVEEFCKEIGIGKRVLRVWMHNNKYMGGKTEKNRASQSSEENGGNDSKQSP
ncbi:zinc-finger homeodomain protein 9 [Cucumis melo var. makuwa]|uniref:Zinc-finger homeodomain protein 9 n=2 Tax=Cucumis melo TaxID=3656 RepID=A0A5A7SX18_CUCMM|nr:zinc-finger homeodomain protein 9 [Cucumis melo var. makuwa]TYK17717.1 zinc-finger homeodomain protein 9 [Cucumis melo var. makuwa]